MTDATPRDDRTPSSAHIARCLAGISGRKHVVLSPAKPARGGPPADVVVQPADALQVADILQWAAASHVPVFPVETDAVAPVRGGVLLDLRRLNRILDIDEPNGLCTVEPAVPVPALQRALAAEGLFFGPDPTGTEERTVGAVAARGEEGAGGTTYGGLRSHVAALEVVLPTGEIIRTGVRALSTAPGYDLTRFFVGTRGTLGVLTRLTLRALPQPEQAATVLLGFAGARAAAEAAAEIASRHVPLAALAFFDLIGFADTGLPEALTRSPAVRAVLLAEVDGTPEQVDRAVVSLREAADAHGAAEWRRADARAERAGLWEARRMAVPALATLAAHAQRLQVALLPGRVPELVRFLETLRGREGAAPVCFGFIGGGSLSICLPHHEDAHSRQAAADAAADIARFVAGLGGASDTPLAAAAVERKLLRQLKAAFDPAGILSPGALLPE